MIVLMGKTASGKTTILKKLVDQYGYKPIVTYTTRPIRKNEIAGVTYHYISNDEFQVKIENDFFAEWKSYETVEGTWYYGSAREDIDNANKREIIILTPSGYRDIIKIAATKPLTIYIYANNQTIKERLKARGDKKEEAERRIRQDNADFKGIEYEVNKVIYNNSGMALEDVIEKIYSFLEEKGEI